MSLTFIILAATVLISIVAFKNQKLFNRLLFSPYLAQKNKEWDRFIGHGFVHVDYMHLFFNMFVLYFFGSNLEEAFRILHNGGSGNILYLLLYVSAVAVAAYPSYRKHKNNFYYKSVGASGAVAAVLFAHIIIMPTAPIYIFFIPIPIPSFIFGGLYLYYEYYMGKKGNSAVAHDAHLGGAVYGILFVVLTVPKAWSNFVSQIYNYIF
ncbi:MAG: rhomboid family intramembrane serine protease [Luteibaculaceae bacterium]